MKQSAVAYYIYKEFYSRAAQAKNNEVTADASRLTNIQFRKSVADLFSDPQGKAVVSEKRGLKAEYFNSRGFAKDKRIEEKVDSRVDFDFGEGSPQEKIGKEEFAIRWTGSLVVPETGEYEITLDTPNGVKIWLNDYSKPFIDAWVASSGQESKATYFSDWWASLSASVGVFQIQTEKRFYQTFMETTRPDQPGDPLPDS